MTDLSTARPTVPTRPWYRTMPKAVIVAGVVLVLALVGVIVYAVTLNHAVESNLRQAPELPPNVAPNVGAEARPPASATGALNFVIVGSDSPGADAGQGQSDTLMVLHLNGDRRGASLISFPRDLKVSIPGHGTKKISSAYALGGGPLTVQTLEDLLDVRMDHVAVIDFDGFIALSDQLGGVTVENPYASQSLGYDFPAGQITLRGEKALVYVREIKDLPGGDITRAQRQRLVVQAMLRKIVSGDMLLNPAKLNRFMGSAARQVTVDRDLTPTELRSTAMSVRFSPEDLVLVQAPIAGSSTSSSGQRTLRVDTARLEELKTALRDDSVADYAARYPNG